MSSDLAEAAERAPWWPVRRAWTAVARSRRRAWKSHPVLAQAALFVVVWAAAAMAWYRRFPNNLQFPNFYAEDGMVYAHNILAHGFAAAMMTTFNGYYVWGLYVLTGAGFLVNGVLHGGQLVELPKGLAAASYAYLGLVAAMPMVLLRPYLSLGWRLVAVLALAFVPLVEFDYGIIGTIGNLKFAFVVVAFMLLAYRLSLPRSSRQIPLVDAGLLVCAYTNATVYFLLPVLLWCDGLRPRQLWRWRSVVARDNVSLWSATALGVLLCYQLAVVALNGIPANPGYLDGPLHKRALPEIVVARSYLFGVTYWWYHFLRNSIALVMFGLAVAAMWRWGRREHRVVYGFAVYTVLVGTALFVANRPGVTGLFHHFGDPGPDQFFYAQNMVFMLALVLLASDLTRRWVRPVSRGLVPLLAAILFVLPLGQAGSYGKHNFMQLTVGTAEQNARVACKHGGKTVAVPVYPGGGLALEAPRSQWCTAAVR